jgi:hypothetical protein
MKPTNKKNAAKCKTRWQKSNEFKTSSIFFFSYTFNQNNNGSIDKQSAKKHAEEGLCSLVCENKNKRMLTHIKRKDSATALHGNANSTKILSFQKIIYCPNLQTLKPSCISLKWYNLIQSMSHGKFPSLTSQALPNSCIPNHLKKLWGVVSKTANYHTEYCAKINTLSDYKKYLSLSEINLTETLEAFQLSFKVL